ncbi:hypothetical protein DZB84_19585 [Bacillus sp. HNG]|uniref:hypothetical protein n=1 Tax=Bacillus sp. HNG TaxID=2293325 RepID=UPI000E2E4C1F|nr:hypothetical protein [Bacillus sp. HNG]RFB12158.1 hypothetical protein DZB84_19585 [Bacillus sp. HNG]
MGTIKINVSTVQLAIPSLQRDSNKVSTIKGSVRGLKSGIDYRIQSRRGIGVSLNQVVSSLNELELKIKDLERFIHNSVQLYQNAERIIDNKSRSLESVRSKTALSLGFIKGYDPFKNPKGTMGAAKMVHKDTTTRSIAENLRNVLDLGQAALNYVGNEANERLEDIESGWKEATSRIDKKRKQMIDDYEFVKDNKKDIFNLLLETGVREGLDMTSTGRAFREKYEYLHYEQRDKLNEPHPTYKEVRNPRLGWIELPESMSVFHDDNKGEPEKKFIHPDGREAVFDGDTLKPVTDARYKGTYNYINPTLMPEGFPNSKQDILDWVEYGKTGLGHVVTDVIPYYMVGQKNERDQQRFQD